MRCTHWLCNSSYITWSEVTRFPLDLCDLTWIGLDSTAYYDYMTVLYMYNQIYIQWGFRIYGKYTVFEIESYMRYIVYTNTVINKPNIRGESYSACGRHSLSRAFQTGQLGSLPRVGSTRVLNMHKPRSKYAPFGSALIGQLLPGTCRKLQTFPISNQTGSGRCGQQMTAVKLSH